MKYPFETDTIIDVTKFPYFADNSGIIDCTAVLCRVFDDVLKREIDGIEETKKKLLEYEGNVCIGFENRIIDGKMNVIYPEFVPPRRIIYFPSGTYLVSDTVTYTLKNLKNIMNTQPFFELTRGIHLMGENAENTVIKLADNSKGFGVGCNKCVVSYTNVEGAMERENTNVSQLNTFTDLCIDCGSGNEGAVALRFVANNSGRVENAIFKGKNSYCAMQLVVGTEGVFRKIQIDGFEVGITASKTSMCVFDEVITKNTKQNIIQNKSRLVLWNIDSREATLRAEMPLTLSDGSKVACSYTLQDDMMYKNGDRLCSINLRYEKIPNCYFNITEKDVAFVDDYGAIGDGKTNSTSAIQSAFESGKPVVAFGSGHYLVNGKIRIPSTTRIVDFMFCDFFAGERLISGEDEALFVIDENSDEPLYMRQVYTFEQFYGHFRFICHASQRTLILKDIHNQASATYFNTVRGGKVYLDNCANTVGTYSMNSILNRGTLPEYCSMIPYEFHGQDVWAYNLNPERADIEVLNDGSILTIFGLKVEGPGMAVKTENRGETKVLLHSAAIGDSRAEHALFYTDTVSKTTVLGGMATAARSDISPDLAYRCISQRGREVMLRNKVDPFCFDIYDRE